MQRFNPQKKQLNKIVQKLNDLASCFRAIFTGANQEIRDYSGKKARQYLVSQEAAVSQDTFRSKYFRSSDAKSQLKPMRKKGWNGGRKKERKE